MTDEERDCTIFAVPTNRAFVTKKKPEKKPLSPEVKARRDFINNNNFYLHTDENGKIYGTMEPRV